MFYAFFGLAQPWLNEVHLLELIMSFALCTFTTIWNGKLMFLSQIYQARNNSVQASTAIVWI